MFQKHYFDVDVDRIVYVRTVLLCNMLFCDRDFRKFLHGDIFYRFNGENVNVMLEYTFKPLKH